jgi:hypothetical protein
MPGVMLESRGGRHNKTFSVPVMCSLVERMQFSHDGDGDGDGGCAHRSETEELSPERLRGLGWVHIERELLLAPLHVDCEVMRCW